jgi:predicted nucleic acid-binding protein
MTSYILDSYAVMEFLRKQKSWEKVADIFVQSSQGKVKLSIHILNWGEIWYTLIREKGEATAKEFLAELKQQINITVLDFDKQTFELAIKYKSKGNISYSDCFALASSVIHNSTLVTGDMEFRQFESSDMSILWL